MPSKELVALVAIVEAEHFRESDGICPTEMTRDRFNYIGSGLVSSGHLIARHQGEYQLTSKGRTAILGEAIRLVTCQDEVWTKSRI